MDNKFLKSVRNKIKRKSDGEIRYLGTDSKFLKNCLFPALAVDSLALPLAANLCEDVGQGLIYGGSIFMGGVGLIVCTYAFLHYKSNKEKEILYSNKKDDKKEERVK